MKYLSEYRDAATVKALAEEIERVAGDRPMTLMEVCGTHTMAIARFGLRALLPRSIRLISGPGCPVCVTPNDFLDRAIAMARLPGTLICTFGDLMRVPGSDSSLERERAGGADIRPVYSTLDALEIARRERTRQVIFLGVGFETTAPTIAAAIRIARTEEIANFSVLCGCRTIPAALGALLSGPVEVHGLILPGHVSAIIGADAYAPVLNRHRIASAVAGFEPTDLMSAIATLVRQICEERPAIAIDYARAVGHAGNAAALRVMHEVFAPCDATWRGIGRIPNSGLRIREAFASHDAEARFPISIAPAKEPAGCICGAILTGMKTPSQCPLFLKSCTPEAPVGACMVSSEGTCAAAARYGDS